MLLNCKICWTDFNSEITANLHFSSNTHLESVKFQKEINENRPVTAYYCEICSKYANSKETLAVHLGSKSHKTKLYNKEAIESMDSKLNLKKTFTVENFRNLDDLNNNQTINGYLNLQNFLKLNTSPSRNGFRPNFNIKTYFNELDSDNSNIIFNKVQPSSPLCRSSSFQFDALKENDLIKPIGLIKSSPNNSVTLNDWKHTITEKNEDQIDDIENFNWCHCCYLKYTSPSEKDKHLKGKDHFKRVEIKEKLANGIVNIRDYCEYCCSKINDENQRVAHLNSSAHNLQVSRYNEYLIAVQKLKNFTMSPIKNSDIPISLPPEPSLPPKQNYVYVEPEKSSGNPDEDMFKEFVVVSEIFKKAGVKIYDFSMAKIEQDSYANFDNDDQIKQTSLKSVGDFEKGLQTIFDSITSIK